MRIGKRRELLDLLRKALINKKVKAFKGCHDYFQLFLTDDSILNLYNQMILAPSNTTIEGLKITEVDITDCTFTIILDNKKYIKMGMTNDDYTGPEAYFYIGANSDLLISG